MCLSEVQLRRYHEWEYRIGWKAFARTPAPDGTYQLKSLFDHCREEANLNLKVSHFPVGVEVTVLGKGDCGFGDPVFYAFDDWESPTEMIQERNDGRVIWAFPYRIAVVRKVLCRGIVATGEHGQFVIGRPAFVCRHLTVLED